MDTKKLRQKILDLAIRGKLVPQDPNDEPASVLLARIKAEKEQLIKEGKIKRSKQSATSDTFPYAHVPFEVPENWCWTSVGDISLSILYGVSESAKSKGKYKLLRITDIQNNKVNWDTVPYSDFEDNVQNYILEEGDILFARTGATVGKSYLVNNISVLSIYASYLIRVKSSKLVLPAYIKFFFESGFYWEQISMSSVGVGQPNVNGTSLASLKIPIPPYNEQIRIVKDSNNWLKLIDALDNNIVELKESIGQIKRKILTLAIHGKLVPQDPNDEPAIELLRRINPNFKPCDNAHYKNLPSGWCECKLMNVCNIVMGQSPDGATINNVSGTEFHQGKIYFTDEYLSHSGLYTNKPTKFAESDSLLLCVRAPVGILNITKRKICIGRGLCAIKPKYEIDNKYWLYVLSAYKYYFECNATGSTFKAISGNTIKNMFISLPPLNEQIRISNTISSLWKIIDAIAAEL